MNCCHSGGFKAAKWSAFSLVNRKPKYFDPGDGGFNDAVGSQTPGMLTPQFAAERIAGTNSAQLALSPKFSDILMARPALEHLFHDRPWHQVSIVDQRGKDQSQTRAGLPVRFHLYSIASAEEVESPAVLAKRLQASV
jgi:hypothetical protein